MKYSKGSIPLEVLKEYLNYCPVTGHLTWIKKLSRKVVVGARAGTQVKDRDNRIIKIFGEVYIEHRVIWFYMTGTWLKQTEHIDHINHKESDNSWCNLRLVTQAENNKNLSRRIVNKTGHVGVWFNKARPTKQFVAEIRDLTGSKKSKSFVTPQEAIICRKRWEQDYGYHPNHGIGKPL